MRSRVLVIDDEAYARQVIRALLERAGFEVVVASSAEEGLKLMRETRPALITLDLMMPGRSGLDLLSEKQRDPSIREIPSLVLSAVGLNAELERAVALGARGTLSKPFSQAQLLEAVRQVIEE
ncbi:MAG: response regulator [Chloroflexota bacterium]